MAALAHVSSFGVVLLGVGTLAAKILRLAPTPTDWNRRKADISERDGGNRSWADCGPQDLPRGDRK
jgi:hypothetical protein